MPSIRHQACQHLKFIHTFRGRVLGSGYIDISKDSPENNVEQQTITTVREEVSK